MRLSLVLALTWVTALAAHAAVSCGPREIEGIYAFQLSGETTISGSAQPTVSLGRIVFDSNKGVSGTSSAKFAGLLLGNPVTGQYDLEMDCTVSWSLQDDSGGYQHFRGVATPGGAQIRFKQTDAGGVRDGLALRMPSDGCKAADLRQKYTFTLSGTVIPVDAVGTSGARKVSAKGVIEQDVNHHFHLKLEGESAQQTDVAISVESDCTLQQEVLLPAEDGVTSIQLRGMLVDQGRQILAIQTDPGAMVSARFRAQ